MMATQTSEYDHTWRSDDARHQQMDHDDFIIDVEWNAKQDFQLTGICPTCGQECGNPCRFMLGTVNDCGADGHCGTCGQHVIMDSKDEARE